MSLTKAMLIRGIEFVHEVEIPALKGTVKLRSLTDAEWSEINAMENASGQIEIVADGDGAKVNPASLTPDILRALNKAHGRAVAYSLSCEGEKWNEEEISNNFPPAIINELFKAVTKITTGVIRGEGGGESVISFRADSGGKDIIVPDPNRLSAISDDC